MDFAQAKRILGPKLPNLTGNTQINEELYIWLAIIYRQFISGWYNKIQPDGPLPQDCVAILQQIVAVLSSKLDELCLTDSIQDIVAILDVHITDTDLAFQRNPDSPEQVYLGINPHDGLPGRRKVDEYFFTVGNTLFRGWLLNAPLIVISLLSTIFQQIMGSVIRSLSEPWLLHELIIKVLDPSNPLVATNNRGPQKQPLKAKKTRKRVMQRHVINKKPEYLAEDSTITPNSKIDQARNAWSRYLQPPLKGGPGAYNASIFLFIQTHLISRSLVGNFLFSLAWPFHSVFIHLTNRILANIVSHVLTIDRYIWISSTLRQAVFPNGYLGPPRMPPPLVVQAQLRDSAMKLLNKRVNWISTHVFDSTVINQRLLLSFCDYLFKLIQ